MAKHGKKYKVALAKVDLDKEYSSRDAVALAHFQSGYGARHRRVRGEAPLRAARHRAVLLETFAVRFD